MSAASVSSSAAVRHTAHRSALPASARSAAMAADRSELLLLSTSFRRSRQRSPSTPLIPQPSPFRPPTFFRRASPPTPCSPSLSRLCSPPTSPLSLLPASLC
eukprot:scaffold3011_cov32-Tisochrysis_lutea.AAC.5